MTIRAVILVSNASILWQAPVEEGKKGGISPARQNPKNLGDCKGGVQGRQSRRDPAMLGVDNAYSNLLDISRQSHSAGAADDPFSASKLVHDSDPNFISG